MKRRLLYFTILILLTFTLLTYIFVTERNNNLSLLNSTEIDHLHSEEEFIKMIFLTISKDLHFLAHTVHLQEYIYEKDTTVIPRIEDDFQRFARSKQEFAQVRYIDKDGFEIVRVDNKNNNIRVIPRAKLQNKKDRYYFYDAIKLDKDAIYVSPLDLNVEQGKLELPYAPMIRFAKPVFDSLGNKTGVVVLNYNGSELLDKLKETANNRNAIKTLLINNNSFYLIGPSEDEEWGFMIPDRNHINMKSQFPEAWNSIKESHNGLVISKEGVFIHISIFPMTQNLISSDGSPIPAGTSLVSIDSSQYFWKLVSYIELKDLKQINPVRFIKFYIIVFLFSFILSHVFATLREQKLESQKLFEESKKQLEEQNKELQNAIDSKNTFFSIISHDLRNPIQVVIGYTGMLIDNYEQMEIAEIKEYFLDIELATDTLLKLLENLLDWSRCQTGNISFRPQMISVDKLINTAIATVRVNAKQKKILICTSLPPKMVMFGDFNMITTVLRNIMTNSIKFTPEEGRLTVNVSPLGTDEIEIEIHDTGVGMSEEECDKLFDLNTKFSKSGTNGEKGTGLGLILSSEFLRRNGGSIKVSSTLGQGTTFKIRLPRKDYINMV